MVKIYFTSKSGAFLQSEVKAGEAVNFANDFLDTTYSYMIVAFDFGDKTKEYVVARTSNTIAVEIRSENGTRRDSVEVECKNLLLKKLISAERSFVSKIAVFQ